MFEIAAIGPFAAGRLGIVRQCIECRAAAGLDAPACGGFGPGCLVAATRNASPASRAEGLRGVRDAGLIPVK